VSEAGKGAVRIDRWLWAARFFRTRAAAQAAIRGGHVHVNGTRVKPSRDVQAGDRLTIARGPERFDIEIRGVTARRGPAKMAAELYDESPDSIARREAERAERALQRSIVTGPDRRPDKRDRRRIVQFTRRREVE
jgi:ribosome-associated heat shock protein Hsp15